ncbi:FxsA family protein [Pseudonocardia sp. HH130630-07]|uniref:FxsA family protein n=1 Tax=Pseudonocardia sp. HH130630-07 TaxID=1690815 RepID=UPI000814BB63|nr:FxsA family protein [Pseudonocardia sp. HH130630-07]ANY06815.1 hypothetical protein AFB00_11525 [Pseudonocardia sp. HH130630-07]
MPFVLLYVVLEVVAIAGLIAWIGLGWTLLVLLAGSVVGLLLARREGVRAFRAMATAIQGGKLAHEEATDSLLVSIGGILIFVPGLITDVLGLALVLPPTRALVRRRMVRAAERAAPGLRTARIRYGATVVDGETVVEDTARPGGSRPMITGTGTGTPGAGPRGSGPVIDGEVVDDGSPADRRSTDG